MGLQLSIRICVFFFSRELVSGTIGKKQILVGPLFSSFAACLAATQ